MGVSSHILVVDDDPRVRALLRRYLAGEGFTVSEAGDGRSMRAALAAKPTDLVLLDLVMPGEDGLTLAREIRRMSEIPIIMLTGKGDLIDRVVGLESGADDYITKPFELREVLARIRTVLRRGAGRAAKAEAPGSAQGKLCFNGWSLDLTRRTLETPAGKPVQLSAAEFDLLCIFARNPNRVLSRDRLMDLIKGRQWEAYDRAIDTRIVRLRKRIEADPQKPSLIKTVRGAGYIFAAAVTEG